MQHAALLVHTVTYTKGGPCPLHICQFVNSQVPYNKVPIPVRVNGYQIKCKEELSYHTSKTRLIKVVQIWVCTDIKSGFPKALHKRNKIFFLKGVCNLSWLNYAVIRSRKGAQSQNGQNGRGFFVKKIISDQKLGGGLTPPTALPVFWSLMQPWIAVGKSDIHKKCKCT